MACFINLEGKRFGRWTVQSPSHVKKGYWYWVCHCVCGTVRTVNGRLLRNGQSGSCGCRGHNWKHGMTKTRTFKSWESMLGRCRNKNDPSYQNYGKRGIKVCRRWLSFENFFADMEERPEGTSLERRDNDKNYEPNNCYWATPTEQQRNKRNSRWLTYKSQTKMLIDWSQDMGIPYDLLLRRVNRGLTDNNLFAPSRSKSVSRFQGF